MNHFKFNQSIFIYDVSFTHCKTVEIWNFSIHYATTVSYTNGIPRRYSCQQKISQKNRLWCILIVYFLLNLLHSSIENMAFWMERISLNAAQIFTQYNWSTYVSRIFPKWTCVIFRSFFIRLHFTFHFKYSVQT